MGKRNQPLLQIAYLALTECFGGILATFYLFFLSDGIAVIAFLHSWVQMIAQFNPTFYGVHALQMAIFFNSSDHFPRDLQVILATTAFTLLLGVWSLRYRASA